MRSHDYMKIYVRGSIIVCLMGLACGIWALSAHVSGRARRDLQDELKTAREQLNAARIELRQTQDQRGELKKKLDAKSYELEKAKSEIQKLVTQKSATTKM